MKSVYISVFIAALAGIIGFISSKYFGNDNPIEEACEQIIKDETGTDIDLTPEPKTSSEISQAIPKLP
jgi:hypothetical protein